MTGCSRDAQKDRERVLPNLQRSVILMKTIVRANKPPDQLGRLVYTYIQMNVSVLKPRQKGYATVYIFDVTQG